LKLFNEILYDSKKQELLKEIVDLEEEDIDDIDKEKYKSKLERKK